MSTDWPRKRRPPQKFPTWKPRRLSIKLDTVLTYTFNKIAETPVVPGRAPLDSCFSRSLKRPTNRSTIIIRRTQSKYPAVVWHSWFASCWFVWPRRYRRCVHGSVRTRGTLVIVWSPGPLNKIRATGRAVCQSAPGLSVRHADVGRRRLVPPQKLRHYRKLVTIVVEKLGVMQTRHCCYPPLHPRLASALLAAFRCS